ncbi:ATPases involved in chromosome partitioning-like protein [Thermofilum pendens Hrk 5]|uniref:ATPases involved in chromosome partitioning-like protein n=1 Tax=Thermofilum pendens (strain DSM 2475 / Hrk 5) TaxID=368408 RepID=A1RY47_THEPD|nr:ATPases involved in chromosome partitioning-like protein [Thermofilum pendens Hrk 5]
MAVRVAFVSGSKGGTGKSVLSSLASFELASMGRKVLLVDLGELGSSTQLCLAEDPGPPYLSDFFQGKASWRDVIVASPWEKLFVAPSSKQQGPVDADSLEYLLEAVDGYVDFVVLDMPAYPGTLYDPVAALAEVLALVMNPDKLSFSAVGGWYVGREFARRKLALPVLNKYHPVMSPWLDRLREYFGAVFTVSFDPALTFAYTETIADAHKHLSKKTREEVKLLVQRLDKPLLKVTR